jgi:two-component system, cell cycle sensor histidine kinase and response regulator CckA
MERSFSASEETRLSAVRRLGILDSGREAAFDTLARLAASRLGTPICLISIMDSDRHWYKAAHGLEMSQTGRDHAFCTLVAEHGDLFMVEDALSDPELATNPNVTGAPHVRFYAGMPIMIGEGLCAGVICVIDHVPRRLDVSERQALRDLARLAEALLSRHADAERVRQIRAELSNQNDMVR